MVGHARQKYGLARAGFIRKTGSGLSLIPVAIGLLAFSEILLQLERLAIKGSGEHAANLVSSKLEDRMLSLKEFFASAKTLLRGTLIGIGIGAMPGLGAPVASFMFYDQAMKRSKKKEEFGKGSLEGIAASESANSAVVAGSLIPLFVLGIPGNLAAAMLMGAFMIHGMQPGPLLFAETVGFFKQDAPSCSASVFRRLHLILLPASPVQAGSQTVEEESLNKRTQYIVDRTFQQRVALNLLAIVLFLPIVLTLNFYLVGIYAMGQNLEVADLPRDWGLVGQMLTHQWWLIIFFVIACVGFSFGLIYYYTHRIAGPVYRFRLLFDEIATGKVGSQVQLRDGDCFENLAASVSRANVTLASSISELKTATAALSKTAGSLGNRELTEQIAKINHLLDRYKTVPISTQESS